MLAGRSNSPPPWFSASPLRYLPHLLSAPPPVNVSTVITINICYDLKMPNMPVLPVVPIVMPNSQAHEPFEWISSDKTESHTWTTDEDGLKCITVTRVTTDKYESWTCTR